MAIGDQNYAAGLQGAFGTYGPQYQYQGLLGQQAMQQALGIGQQYPTVKPNHSISLDRIKFYRRARMWRRAFRVAAAVGRYLRDL